ncbi:hypothetical protein [Agrococcus sp. KRD186]|uniref:hypothetical protein n=1 Tax=Agrococcus sp. KRD186 TaxID=2729730 RepID=UPI0019D30211|nr:hypothetical protein [Agrococcus sp. KRD186]
MGSVLVDQIGPAGQLLSDFDVRLSNRRKMDLLLQALPGAQEETYSGEQVVRFNDQLILKKQVTHLGIPWPAFKKRIQIPKKWLDVHRQALSDGLTPRFVGIYHYSGVTIFVDFDPSSYMQRKANNSAAHVATNDLFQAQTLGVFSRQDRNGNRLTSVRAAEFSDYLLGVARRLHPRIELFERFNSGLLSSEPVMALDAIKEMHEVQWPDRFQGEWPGFYLEFRFDRFVRQHNLQDRVSFQKAKKRGDFDFDLIFGQPGEADYYGDLKASNLSKSESPGNDAETILECVQTFGRFWYVLYEHETWHGKSQEHAPTIAWNEWRRSVGYQGRNPYNALSYASRFKAAVSYVQMSILEINEANFHLALGQFNQGQQPGGATRAPKVMILKRDIDNFLIYSERVR